MNTQISDFNAAYGGRSAGMQPGSGMQPGMGRGQQSATFPGSAEGSGMVGTRQGSTPSQPMQSAQGVGFPGSGGMPLSDLGKAQPASAESMQYLNGFLRTQIGNRIRVEFLIGTNTYLERSGKLVAMGANYIILQEAMSDDLLVCDFFNIKFVTIYR